jgi:hypothetical protein
MIQYIVIVDEMERDSEHVTLVATRGPNFLEARLVNLGPNHRDDFRPLHVANDELFNLQSQIVIKRYR